MKCRHLAPLVLLITLATVRAAEPARPGAAPLDAYRAVGATFALDNRLHRFGWSEAQVEAFLDGLRAAFRGSPPPMDPAVQDLMQEIGRRLQQLEQEERRRAFGAEAFARPGHLDAYLKRMRAQFGLQASDSGLWYSIKNPGSGARPEPEDEVVISCKVTAADAETELPALGGDRLRVKVSQLVPGVAEGLQMMSVGSAAILVVPPALSYGDGDWPGGAERGTPLIFTIVLHEIAAPPVQ